MRKNAITLPITDKVSVHPELHFYKTPTCQLMPLNIGSKSHILLEQDKNGFLKVETSEGDKFTLKEQKDILRLFPSEYNWTCNRNNQFDSILKVFSNEQLVSFDFTNEITFGDYILSWIYGTSKLKLKHRLFKDKVRYLVNLASYVKNSVPLDTFGHLDNIELQLEEINKVIPISLTSLAGLSRNIILDPEYDLWPQFKIAQKLTVLDREFLARAYLGPRQEARSLGIINSTYKIDKNRAHLTYLSQLPSLGKNILKIARNTKYFSNAHPGSVYLVEVSVPDTYKAFSPVGLSLQGHTLYPTGNFITAVSKPILDLIIELGDISFRVLDSLQIILKDPTLLVFKDVCQTVENFEDALMGDYPYFKLKSMHAYLAGQFIQTYEVYKQGKLYIQASGMYNPILANAIYAMQDVDIFRLAMQSNAVLLRADAVTAQLEYRLDGFKTMNTTKTVAITDRLKGEVTPNNNYIDDIERNRNEKYLTYEYEGYTRLHSSNLLPGFSIRNRTTDIGKKKIIKQRVYPRSEFRKITTPPIYLGQLLDETFTASIPNIGYDPMHDKELIKEIEGRRITEEG